MRSASRISAGNSPAANATPIAEFASSTSPYASTRGSVLAVSDMSDNRVCPPSPVRV